MNCKDCNNFKTNQRIEAGKELAPSINGKCNVNGKDCSGQDKCGCGGFSKK